MSLKDPLLFPPFLGGTIHSSWKVMRYGNKINHWDRGCFTATFNVYEDIKGLFVWSSGLHICSALLLCNYFVPNIMCGNITAGTYCKAVMLNHFIWSVIISCNWSKQIIIFVAKYIGILLGVCTYKELWIYKEN